jgi:SAM-dependent methyltransferase
MGKPNIRRHPLYRNVLERKGRLLDYGSGTGDDIRALIEDGYPKSRITAYDVNWDSINLGFDLYLDEERLQGIFVVSKEFPFGPREFDAVYSGSVLHGFEEIEEMTGYLKNALEALVEKGLLFGSTVGADEPVPKGDEGFPPTPLLERQLRQLLERSGFKDLKISRTEEESAGRPKYRFWFSGIRP